MTREERGFTLIELLVAVVISSILTGGMLAAMFVGLRTLDDTTQRIAGANDTQLVAGYFTPDIVSSEAISTTGTTSHAAPSVSASAANSRLVALWALNTGTPVTPPDGMAEAWETQSTGTDPALHVTVSMADQALTATGPTDTRFAESAVGTSSLAHSVALAPAALSTVSRRPAVSAGGTTAAATQITLGRPTGTQTSDVLLAQLAVRGGTTTVTTPNGWTLVQQRSSSELRSLIYRHTAASSDPAGWTWIFNSPRESAGGMAAFAGVGTVGAPASDVSPCTGETPILLLSWTDRGTTVAHEVVYDLLVVGSETHLVRSHCEGESGTPVSTQTLARELGATASGVAECEPVACGPMTSPVNVTLTLNDPPSMHSTVPRTYQMRGSTRVTA
jgi:prepilin-type N-terminal cleavage/methylation domain-containing protein